MRAIDAAASEPAEVLIERAGAAVARVATAMLGGTYGRQGVVIAGKGNNGNDGRVAARRLARRGVHVSVVAPETRTLPPAALVIDAAFGTGYRETGNGGWSAPETDAPVLAVDIPSGVDGLTGLTSGRVLAAQATVTFAALKPGLLFPPGRQLAGEVRVADIGLPAASATHVVEAVDVRTWLPARAIDAHKWDAAVWVVAGSAEMIGAAHLVARAAQRAGAGMVRLSSPGVGVDPGAPTEAVRQPLSGAWADDVLAGAERFGALVVGPGLGRADAVLEQVRALVGKAPGPLVVDADALFALAGRDRIIRSRSGSTVLTPHDGEYARIAGHPPGPDRLAAARRMAADQHSIVLLKGPTTVVAEPGGCALVVTTGDQRLASAGTGDVLAGVIGALLAQGMPAFEAAAAGAWLHGAAAHRAPAQGMVAGDLVDHLPEVLP
jgi:ADP-dependent NAD(P)H-hydrate dehydratase / NAD(P)H-hydrate epimerase